MNTFVIPQCEKWLAYCAIRIGWIVEKRGVDRNFKG